MPGKHGGFLDRLLQRRTISRWERAARLAPQLDTDDLHRLRGEARLLRREVDRVLHVADSRLALPLNGGDGIERPLGCDWAWRPALWSGPVRPQGVVGAQNRDCLGGEVTLFHDCGVSELTLRQIRNLRREDVAPYGLSLDVMRFDGSFLSLVLDLPDRAVDGLRRSHLLRVALDVEIERPLEIFCRLNIKHGPNTEQLVRELPLSSGQRVVDFDLAYTRMNEKRLEKAWVDLIFEGAQMNRIVLHDLTFVRHPRANI